MRRPVFEAAVIEAICRTIAVTNDGLTGTEIGGLLTQCSIKEIDLQSTKWKRLTCISRMAKYQSMLKSYLDFYSIGFKSC